jgi:hypothetical protein
MDTEFKVGDLVTDIAIGDGVVIYTNTINNTCPVQVKFIDINGSPIWVCYTADGKKAAFHKRKTLYHRGTVFDITEAAPARSKWANVYFDKDKKKVVTGSSRNTKEEAMDSIYTSDIKFYLTTVEIPAEIFY